MEIPKLKKQYKEQIEADKKFHDNQEEEMVRQTDCTGGGQGWIEGGGVFSLVKPPWKVKFSIISLIFRYKRL